MEWTSQLGMSYEELIEGEGKLAECLENHSRETAVLLVQENQTRVATC